MTKTIDPVLAVDTVLEASYWVPTLAPRTRYTRRHDDTDGQRGPEQDLSVSIGPDGDCWVEAGGGGLLRFRTWAGGGMSLRTRNALMVLAEAIRRDNQDRPQHMADALPPCCTDQPDSHHGGSR